MSWLKADGSDGSAPALLKFLAGLDEIYLAYTAHITPALEAFGAGVNQSPTPHALIDATTPSAPWFEGLISYSGNWTELLPNGPGGLLTPFTAGDHTIAVHAKISTDTLVITIDGTDYDLSGNGYWALNDTNQLDQLFVGSFDTWVTDPSNIWYISGFTAGTTGPGSSDLIDEDFTDPTFGLWDTLENPDRLSLVDTPDDGGGGGGGGDSSVVVKIYDLASNELADISSIALEKSLVRKLNAGRTFTVQAPAAHTLLTTIAGDGYPNLRRGNRKIIAWEASAPTQPIFHGRIWTVERVGDGTENLVTITAQDPWAELGYDSNDQAGRIVRGSTTQPTAGDPYGEYDGNFISPLFASSVSSQDGISGPDLILQVLTNSLNTGDESDPTPGEGPLPIDLGGTFDLDVPDAVDLSVIGKMTWPVAVGDFIQQLVETGVCDVDMRPVDPTESLAPYAMVQLSAVSAFGTDRSGTVHFDYWTGSFNASAARHVEDFSTINNKLYDYLGPPETGGTRFPLGNITPGSPGTAVDPSDSRSLYGGQFMSIRITDWVGSPSDARPFAIALWNAEQSTRVEPRGLLYITPAPDIAGLFSAPADFDVGDIIAVNVGAALGIALADTQRVYGYTKTWDRQGVARLSELLTSADE